VLTDGFIGQMMEPLQLEAQEIQLPAKPWAVRGNAETRKNLISSIYLEPDELEAHVLKLDAKYKKAAEVEARHELYNAEDPEILLVGYGITSRVLRSVVDMARKEGLRAGLFRPITVWPFPAEALRKAARRAQMVLVVEMSTGQMVEDVRLALDGRVDVEFYGRAGGNVPLADEVCKEVFERMGMVAEWGV
jgi:pyruvate/2-oxoacid:ferredoxin oxidoreductase alpha subunit